MMIAMTPLRYASGEKKRQMANRYATVAKIRRRLLVLSASPPTFTTDTLLCHYLRHILRANDDVCHTVTTSLSSHVDDSDTIRRLRVHCRYATPPTLSPPPSTTSHHDYHRWFDTPIIDLPPIRRVTEYRRYATMSYSSAALYVLRR